MHTRVAVPIYSIKVTPEEITITKEVRTHLKNVLLEMNSIADSLEDFSAVISEIMNPDDIKLLRKQIVAYKHMTQESLNLFLELIEETLIIWNKMISDTNFEEIKKAFVEEVRKIREYGIDILEALRDLNDKRILVEIPSIIQNIVTSKKAIDELISTNLFQKIDKDILGRIRIGSRLQRL